MDYILEQVKEKGIVKYINSYLEDLEIMDNHKKCMEEIEKIKYRTKGNMTSIDNYPRFLITYKLKENKIDIERRTHTKYVLNIITHTRLFMRRKKIETVFTEKINLTYPEQSYNYYKYRILNTDPYFEYNLIPVEPRFLYINN